MFIELFFIYKYRNKQKCRMKKYPYFVYGGIFIYKVKNNYYYKKR